MTLPEDEFRRAMLATYDQAKELVYDPNYFLRTVEQQGALTTAKRLLASEEIQIEASGYLSGSTGAPAALPTFV